MKGLLKINPVAKEESESYTLTSLSKGASASFNY